jgi:hypothetical protein
VLDVAAGGNQKVSALVERKIIGGDKLIPLTEITKTPEADVEDLFDVGFYLELLKLSGVGQLKELDLTTKGRVLKRVEVILGKRFDHYQPARYLLEHQGELLAKISPEALDRFEALFAKANALLP